MTNKNTQIWKSTSTDDYFLIASNESLKPGAYTIEDLNGNQKSVDLKPILPFRTSEENILEFLKSDYEEKLKAVRESLVTLNAFAVRTGKFDESSLKNLVKTEFDKMSEEEQEPFTFGKELIEDLMSSINDKNATPEQQMANFQKTMGKVPEVMKYFDENNLALAAKDPEAWAKTIHDKMFGEEEKAKKAAYTENLKREVQESIARGLREAGMEPIDINKKSDKP